MYAQGKDPWGGIHGGSSLQQPGVSTKNALANATSNNNIMTAPQTSNFLDFDAPAPSTTLFSNDPIQSSNSIINSDDPFVGGVIAVPAPSDTSFSYDMWGSSPVNPSISKAPIIQNSPSNDPFFTSHPTTTFAQNIMGGSVPPPSAAPLNDPFASQPKSNSDPFSAFGSVSSSTTTTNPQVMLSSHPIALSAFAVAPFQQQQQQQSAFNVKGESSLFGGAQQFSASHLSSLGAVPHTVSAPAFGSGASFGPPVSTMGVFGTSFNGSGFNSYATTPVRTNNYNNSWASNTSSSYGCSEATAVVNKSKSANDASIDPFAVFASMK